MTTTEDRLPATAAGLPAARGPFDSEPSFSPAAAAPAGDVRLRRLAVAAGVLCVTGVAFMVVGLVWLRPATLPHAMFEEWVSQIVSTSCLTIPAAFLAYRLPRHPVGWLLLLIPASYAVSGAGMVWANSVDSAHPLPGAAVGIALVRIGVVSEVGLPMLLLLFPEGHLPSRRWRPVAALTLLAAGLVILAGALAPLSLMFDSGDGALAPEKVKQLPDLTGVHFGSHAFWTAVMTGVMVVDLLVVFPAVVSLVVRYRRAAADARAQLRWLLVGAVAVAASIVGFHLLPPGPSLAVEAAGYAVIAVCISVAVLRYRLNDVDLVINRALVYGVLIGLLGLLYAGVVAAAGLAVGHGPASYLAAAVVAVSFAPVRGRLSHLADRWLRGTRNDPYGVVASLAGRLETSDDTDDVLAATAEAVLQAFRADWVRVELESADGASVVGETSRPGRPPAGSEPEKAVRLPLVHHGGHVGSVALFAVDGLHLAPEDERLLADLLRQAGVAAHAVDVTARLQEARKRLVTTREEERRRMRRDLHDGLGPQLAAMTLKLDAIRNLLRRDPDAAEALVIGAKDDVATAVTDVRRLVHDLRPPALDELGLGVALEQQVARFRRSGPTGLDVDVELPNRIEGLSAAAEVAAYRIVSEALTNIARHADARWCRVTLLVEEDLRVRIEDDGCGIAPDTPSGVGLMSMRERAAELGGTCRVRPRTGGGTVVEARLPRQREASR